MKISQLYYLIDDKQRVCIYQYMEKYYSCLFRGSWGIVPWDLLKKDLYRIKVMKEVLILEVY